MCAGAALPALVSVALGFVNCREVRVVGSGKMGVGLSV